MSEVIKVSHLSKHFKDFKAVDDLSFSVQKGQVYGFLGQNGAGKSTTIRMLMTLIEPTTGTIEIFGKKLATHRFEILKNIGAVIERPDLYKYLSAYENLSLFAKLSGIKPTRQLLMDQLEKVGLADRAKDKMKTFSQGMKQRLGIATALVHNPDLIILDEPVNGLDPQGIADVRNLILHMKNDLGKTVLLSSHLLSEMEMIATDLLIIHKGKKIIEGNAHHLLNPQTVQIELIAQEGAAVLQKIQQTHWASNFKNQNDHKLIFELKKEEVAVFNKTLVELNIGVESLRPRHSLEDYFLEITSH